MNLIRLAITCALFATLGCGHSGGPSGEAPPDLTVHAFLTDGYSTLRQMSYAVDDQLGLSLTKQIRIELFPQILDLSEIGAAQDLDCDHAVDQPCGRAKLKPLRSGRYLLRYAVMRNTFEAGPEAYQLLSGGEIIVDIAAGTLISEIPLKLSDLRVAGARNHLLLGLSMIDESKIQKTADGFAPAPGFSMADIEDSNSNLGPDVFETTLDANVAPRLVFAPYQVSQLEASAQNQIESFAPWLASESAEFAQLRRTPVHLKGLADVVALARTLERFESAKQEKQKSQFASAQNLLEWPAAVAQMADVKRIDLQAVMHEGRTPERVYRGLCELWINKIFPDLAHERFQVNDQVPDRYDFLQTCAISHYQELSQFPFFRRLGLQYEPFFIFQNIYWVDEAQFENLVPPGRNYTVQVTDRFYVRSRLEHNYEVGLRPLSWIPLIGPYLSLAGTLAIDQSLKEDTGNELRFQTNLQLNVEENTMAITLKKYRRCLIVRINPDKMKNYQVQQFVHAVPGDLARDQMRRAMLERGLLVCDPAEAKPVTKFEIYRYIYPSKGNGLQQDPLDLRNQDITLPLRGQRDFQVFMEAGKSVLVSPDTTAANFAGLTEALGGIESAFSSVAPASAGIFVDRVFY